MTENTINAHGYGGYGHTLKYIRKSGGLYLDSGLLRAPSAVGMGFTPEQFENALLFCPLNPEKIKPAGSFSPTNYKNLDPQNCTAFPGIDPKNLEDNYYFRKGVGVAGRPGRLFSGKMKQFIQCLHGARTKSGVKKNLNIGLSGNDNGTSVLDTFKLGDFDLTPDTILHTDPEHYRYFLIRLTSYSALIAEIVFDSNGEKILKTLRSGSADFSKLSLEKVEGNLFSCAKSVKDVRLIDGQFDVRAEGTPFAHGWNANWDGSQAAMVPVIQTEWHFTTCVAQLSIGKISQPNPQEPETWTDTWSFTATISQRVSQWNPHRVSDNIWIGTENVFVGPTYHPAANAPVYCWFDRNQLIIKSYSGDSPKYQEVDTKWQPTPRNPNDYWGIYCGDVNCSKTIEYRYNYYECGFGGKIAQNGYIYRIAMQGASSPKNQDRVAVFYAGDGCTGEVFDVKTIPSNNSHPAVVYYNTYTFTQQTSYRLYTGASFIYISPFDPECCFVGVLQTSSGNSPDTYTSTSYYSPYTDHYNYDPNTEDGWGSFVARGNALNSCAPGSGSSSYIPGQNQYLENKNAVFVYGAGEVGIGTESHNSLYRTPNEYPGTTGFVGYAQVSALNRWAIYSTEDTVASTWDGCGAVAMADRWIGNV